jgi:pimeloyl-ACP methyl ester carboxylesterase
MSKSIIIGIHGLGNKPSPRQLTAWWRAAIEEGLTTQTGQRQDFAFEMVYWARLLYQEPLDPTVSDEKDPLYIEDPYVPAPKNPPPDKQRDLQRRFIDYLGHQLDDIFLNKDLTSNFASISDFVIRRFFSDLGIYYQTADPENKKPGGQMKAVIRALLAETLRRHRHRKILLIAHSMGSIIAYDVLTQLTPEVEIDTLVTIGSPMGMPFIRSKTAAELSATAPNEKTTLKTPENIVHHWFNLADSRDRIALYDQLSPFFAPNHHNVGVIDYQVVNDYSYQKLKNPHKAYGYLRSPEMARIIDGFLKRKRVFAPWQWLRRLTAVRHRWIPPTPPTQLPDQSNESRHTEPEVQAGRH